MVRLWYDDAAGEGDPPRRPHPTAPLAAATSSLFGLNNANFATINRLYQRFISSKNCNCIPQDSFGAIERYAFYLLQLVQLLCSIRLETKSSRILPLTYFTKCDQT